MRTMHGVLVVEKYCLFADNTWEVWKDVSCHTLAAAKNTPNQPQAASHQGQIVPNQAVSSNRQPLIGRTNGNELQALHLIQNNREPNQPYSTWRPHQPSTPIRVQVPAYNQQPRYQEIDPYTSRHTATPVTAHSVARPRHFTTKNPSASVTSLSPSRTSPRYRDIAEDRPRYANDPSYQDLPWPASSGLGHQRTRELGYSGAVYSSYKDTTPWPY